MTLGIGVTLIGIGLVVLDRESGDSVSTEQSGRALAVGYLMAFGAAVCQALGNVATKLGGEHDALSMAIFRASVGAATLLVYIAIRYGLSSAFRPLRNEMREAPEASNGFMWPWSRYPIWSTLIVATIIGTYLGIWLQVAGLRYAPSTGIAATLSSTSPIFVLPLAALFMGDTMRVKTVVAALIAVVGVGILLLPPGFSS